MTIGKNSQVKFLVYKRLQQDLTLEYTITIFKNSKYLSPGKSNHSDP